MNLSLKKALRKGEKIMYNEIKLEKGLYNITGKSFTKALTDLDPDENYKNTELEGLDAFERQLKRFDIKVQGENCDRVERFFMSTESAVLFPEFVRRSIKEGMDQASILSEVVAATTLTDEITYRGLTISKAGTDDAVSEGTSIPSTNVRLSATSITLSKYARKLSCSYESIRKQRIETFAVILKDLGAQISRAVNAKATNVLSTGVTQLPISGEELTYSDLASFWASMNKYNMTTMLCSPADMAKILAFEEMKYCVSDYMTSGMVKTPYGVTLVKCPELTENIAIGVDKNCALEMIFGTDVVVDFNKLISTQCDEIACSIIVGFSKIATGAIKVLKTVKSAS